jgi:hypothetical protein
MNNPGLYPALWAVIDRRLWHATGPTQLNSIISDGEIRVMGGRYENSLCKLYGAVSLLDLGPTAVDLPNQFCNWVGFMGDQQNSRVAVWLEIDRDRVAANLDDAETCRGLWRGVMSRRIISGVESCHRGAIPIAVIPSVLLIDRHYDHTSFRRCGPAWDVVTDSIAHFEQDLRPPPPESPLVEAIKAARERQIRSTRDSH